MVVVCNARGVVVCGADVKQKRRLKPERQWLARDKQPRGERVHNLDLKRETNGVHVTRIGNDNNVGGLDHAEGFHPLWLCTSRGVRSGKVVVVVCDVMGVDVGLSMGIVEGEPVMSLSVSVCACTHCGGKGGPEHIERLRIERVHALGEGGVAAGRAALAAVRTVGV